MQAELRYAVLHASMAVGIRLFLVLTVGKKSLGGGHCCCALFLFA
jgi:hypothetical protein